MLEDVTHGPGETFGSFFISLVWRAMTTREGKEHMTHETPPEGVAALDAEIAKVRQTVTHLSQHLALMEQDIMSGETDRIRDSAKLLSDIRAWAKLAIETEARFDERRKRDHGVVYDYALDLARARETIGCRMARLRRCCRAK